MKKYKFILLISLLTLSIVSCQKDLLDTKNLGAVDGTAAWQDNNLTLMLLYSLYNDRPGYDNTGNPMIENIADESRNTTSGSATNVLQGQWDPSSAISNFDFWAYSQVRKTNEFIKGINEKSTLPDSLQKRYLGEARFLRAFLYFDMVKRYGGVPIITKPQSLEDSLLVKKNTLDECYKFVTDECDSAAILLRLTKGAMPTGRATVGAALALKSRTLLYYASQLYNTTNDLTRWANAAKAAQDVINLNKYSLYPDVSKVILNKSNSEIIFEVQYSKPLKQHGWDATCMPLSIANGVASKRCPLQELVDAFPMAATGKTIRQAGSGYVEQDNQLYVGRDLRFYATVVYHNSQFMGRIQPTNAEDTQNGFGNQYCTVTGYYQRKGVNETNKDYVKYTGSDQNWPEIRYAEILLNFAEAKNEAEGAVDTVFTVLNTLRKRAGIQVDLVRTDINQDSLRNLIRNERYIELAYECKRYWDLRRWKIADQANVLNGKKYTGMKVTQIKDAGGNVTGYKYSRVTIDAKPSVFLPKMYYMPIPQAEITKNGNLQQNTGW